MLSYKRTFCLILSVVYLVPLTACKVSQDAIAASQQMTATSVALNDYYGTLDAAVGETIALYELDAANSGIPYTAESRSQQVETRAALIKRKEMAEALGRLSASMAALANTRAASDVADAATKLGNELVLIKALPDASPVPESLAKAGNFLIQIIQQHEEKKAARAVDDTLRAVGELFATERPAYDSIARSHDLQAKQVAEDLIKSNAVDPSPMLAPALRPFGLGSLPPSSALQTSLKSLALSRLQASASAATRREEVASEGMLAALHEMTTRVHQIATEKPMPLRSVPFTLKAVENWAESWTVSRI